VIPPLGDPLAFLTFPAAVIRWLNLFCLTVQPWYALKVPCYLKLFVAVDSRARRYGVLRCCDTPCRTPLDALTMRMSQLHLVDSTRALREKDTTGQLPQTGIPVERVVWESERFREVDHLKAGWLDRRLDRRKRTAASGDEGVRDVSEARTVGSGGYRATRAGSEPTRSVVPPSVLADARAGQRGLGWYRDQNDSEGQGYGREIGSLAISPSPHDFLGKFRSGGGQCVPIAFAF
jgi:hypothetical protein